MGSRVALALCTLALATACGGGEGTQAAPMPPSLALSAIPTPSRTCTPNQFVNADCSLVPASPTPSTTATRDDTAYLNQLRDELPGSYAFCRTTT